MQSSKDKISLKLSGKLAVIDLEYGVCLQCYSS